jgi:DNA-binding NarL/FixJ family response regulator
VEHWGILLHAPIGALLSLLARGLSRREVAGKLFLSEHTVRHYLEHIYDKIGVRTRVAATLFAVEHDLLN